MNFVSGERIAYEKGRTKVVQFHISLHGFSAAVGVTVAAKVTACVVLTYVASQDAGALAP